MLSLTKVLRRLHASDAGISLVEVMVSVTVLAVAMSAVASTTIQSLTVARDSRDTVLASNVAQFELERLRSIPFRDWEDVSGSAVNVGTREVTLDNGITYEITREVERVSAGSDVDACTFATSGAGTGSDYVRVTQRIVFTNRDVAPVTNTTIITPRYDFIDERGYLAVTVRNRDGVGTPGHVVQVSGLGGSKAAITDANGCAFFSLAVDIDTPANNGYDLIIATDDHIDLATLEPTISETAYVGLGQTTVLEYQYDEQAAYEVIPTVPVVPMVDTNATPPNPLVGSRTPADGCAVAEDAGDLVCVDGTTGQLVPLLPDGQPWRAAIPQDLGIDLYNGNQGHVVRTDAVPPAAPSGTRPLLVTGLYPYNAGFSVHTGRCPGSDPGATGVDAAPQLASQPGETTQASLEMATTTVWTGTRQIDLFDADGDGNLLELVFVPQSGQDVWMEMRDEDTCPDGDRLYLGRSDANGRLTAVVPFGMWFAYARAPLPGGSVAPPAATLPYSCTGSNPQDPLATACYEVRADYRVVQDIDGEPCSGSSPMSFPGGSLPPIEGGCEGGPTPTIADRVSGVQILADIR